MIKENNDISDLEKLKKENEDLKKRLLQSKENQKRVLSFGKQVVLGGNLRKAISNLVDEYPNEIKKSTLADTLYFLIVRITRLSIIGLMLTLLPLAILIIQSFIFNKQTNLIEQQNTKIESDLNLTEASRRNSFINSIAMIYDVLDDKRNYEEDGNLNQRTVKKISSILDSYKPYKYYENGKLTNEAKSPEKGQIVQILLKEDLPYLTLFSIYNNARLNKTELKDARIKDSYLAQAMLLDSDLSESYFVNMSFERTQLLNSTIVNAKFDDCSLIHTNFWNSNLESTWMTNSNLLGSILVDCNLSNVDFSNSILIYAKLDSSDMTGAILENTIVGIPNWFELAEQNGIKGIANLKERYEINTDPIYFLKTDMESLFLGMEHPDWTDKGPKMALGTYVTKYLYNVPDTIEGYVIKLKIAAHNTR